MALLDKLLSGDISFFDISVSEQIAYLKKIGIASTDYDRSYKQYRGQALFMTRKKSFKLSVISVFGLLVLFPYYAIIGLFLKKEKEVDAISRANEDEQFIPDSLMRLYKIERNLWNTKSAISPRDIPFVLNLCVRYCFHPFFLFKILFKVAKYSALIYRFTPKALIVNDEFSFTSSILTHFCERHNVKHIDVQHGEKLFILRDSFFRFHDCYVWNDHYKELLISLNAEPSQFKIELPGSMVFDLREHYKKEYYADFKYYLTVYSEEQLSSIVKSFDFAMKEGKTVKFRPHPNYSDMSLLKKYVQEEQIEYSNVNILDSIASTQHVVGVYTTVLTQAYFNGQCVIIDDMSFKKQYEGLKDLNYILIDKVKNRLSDYQTA